MGTRWIGMGLSAWLLACASEGGNDRGDGDGNQPAQAGSAGQAAGVPAAGQSAGTQANTAGTSASIPAAGAAAGTGSAGEQVPVAGSAGVAGVAGGEPSGDCASQGLDFEGMVYSPGGTVLPHPCEPFHPTLNNPYAVLCVDAWPWYDSGFPGDDFCILPPPPDKGVQIGVHPQGREWFAQVSTGDLSGYENPTADFLMDPGQEEERNYITGGANPEQRNYYRSYVRMRAGSHHMIVYHGPSNAQQEVWGAGGPQLGGNNRVPGAQRPDQNNPMSLEKPAEDAGLYSVFPAQPSVTYNMHHFNSTDGLVLKENWTNLWWETEDATIELLPISGIDIGIFVAPGQTVDLHNVYSITEPVRIVDLFGHRHVWTPNFSAWVQRNDGSTEIVYQSFDWYDQPTYRYDSVAQNPLPDANERRDGATSGALMLNSGDQLHFNCHIAFTDARAAETNAPSPASVGTLVFANQAFDAEMCILFGTTAGRRLPAMTRSATPPPDFARAE